MPGLTFETKSLPLGTEKFMETLARGGFRNILNSVWYICWHIFDGLTCITTHHWLTYSGLQMPQCSVMGGGGGNPIVSPPLIVYLCFLILSSGISGNVAALPLSKAVSCEDSYKWGGCWFFLLLLLILHVSKIQFYSLLHSGFLSAWIKAKTQQVCYPKL